MLGKKAFVTDGDGGLGSSPEVTVHMTHLPRSEMDRAPRLLRRIWLAPRPAQTLTGIALAFVLPWFAAWMAADLQVFERFPGLPFLVATVAASMVGRLAAGLIAVISSGLLIAYFRVPPSHSFDVGEVRDVVGLLLFMAIALMIAYVLAVRDATAEREGRARAEVQALARQLAAERNTVQLVVQQQPNGVMVVDADGKLTVVNLQAKAILGIQDVDGARSSLEIPWRARHADDHRSPRWDEPLARSLRTGEVIQGERLQIGRLDGLVLDLEVDSAPLIAPDDGSIVGAIAVFQDVTERVATHRALEKATRSLERLQAVTDVALSGLSFDELAHQLLERLRAVTEADAATLLLIDRTGTALVEHSTVGIATDQHEAVPIPIGAGIAGAIAARRAPLVVRDIAAHEVVRSWLSTHMRSLMGAPLIHGDRITGVVHVSSTQHGRFDQDDVDVIELAASRIASALEQALLHDSRSAMAHALQRSLLPLRLPVIEGIDLAASYHAYGPNDQVGGDFYDVFPHGHGGWGIVVGDVAGKGPDAAAIMSLAAHSVRALARNESEPSTVLRALNETILSDERVPADRFVTACLMRLCTDGGRATLSVCSAGHPLPLILRADGRIESVGQPGTLIGILGDPTLVDQDMDLGPGDSLVAFTDGLVERRERSYDDGLDELRQVLRGCADAAADAILATLERTLIVERPVEDDVVIVVISKR